MQDTTTATDETTRWQITFEFDTKSFTGAVSVAAALYEAFAQAQPDDTIIHHVGALKKIKK